MAKAETQGKSAAPPWEAKKATTKRGLVRRVLIWAGILGVVAVIGWGLAPKPIELELGVVKRGPLTVYVSEEGKTRIRNRYIVSAPVAGSMRRVPLKPGDEVIAGETVLTVIEPSLAPLLDVRGRTQAEARVAGATAARMQAEQGLEMTRTASRFAQTNWDRVKGKLAQGSISEMDRDQIEREALTREREVRASEFALKVAEYELEQARAALLQIDTPGGGGATVEVRAPVSGRILRVQQESAMVVAPGTPILEIGDPGDLEIEAEILSRDAVGIQPGAPVVVEQWGGDEPLRGKVRRIEPAAFTKVSALGVEEQRVIVLVDLDASPGAVQAVGDRYRVEVRVAVWHDDDVLLVPAGGLFREGSQWKTYIFDAGKARLTTVETGRTDGKQSQVLSGLKAGDRILLHPPDSVKDGAMIQERAAPAG